MDNFQVKKFGDSYFQCNIGTDSPGTREILQNFNIKESHVDLDELLLGILAAAVIVICSTENRLNGYSPDQLVFGFDMIIPINIRWIVK